MSALQRPSSPVGQVVLAPLGSGIANLTLSGAVTKKIVSLAQNCLIAAAQVETCKSSMDSPAFLKVMDGYTQSKREFCDACQTAGVTFNRSYPRSPWLISNS